MRYRSGLNFLLIILFAGLLACKSNLICPAFQSTYILDDSLRLMAFSPFGPDSMPKYGPWVRKNKNGVIVRETYIRKNYEFRTVKMENQYVPLAADSISFDDNLYQDELAADSVLAASADTPAAPADSSVVDKPATGPVNKPAPRKYIRNYDPKDNYNEEQVFYNKHFGELFLAPKEVPAAEDSVQASGQQPLPADSLAGDGESRRKGLFRKKDKQPVEPPLSPADSTGTGF